MKRFVYLSIALACLSMVLLTGVLIGSHTAQAQSPSQAVAYAHMSGFDVAIASNGDTYEKGIETGGVWAFYGNIFGGSSGEAVDIDVISGAVYALASNGDVFEKSTSTGWTWTFTGNIFGGPISVETTTWGNLKKKDW